jgi:ketosteroid isomerase-like protein
MFFSMFVSAMAEEIHNAEIEQQIRKLDLLEAEAMQQKDLETLDRVLAENFLVNSPRNEIVTGKRAVQDLVRNGIINYSSFKREIESIVIENGVAIVMGMETIKPVGKAPGAGQTIQRRYTNIWLNKNGNWLLTARHANVICRQ